MNQRTAFAAAAGLVAFVVVLLGALAAYVAVRGPVAAAPVAAPAGGVAAPDTSGTAPAVTADQATQIALAAVPGAQAAGAPTLVSINGAPAWAVPLDQGVVYIDAQSGAVLFGQRRR